LEIEKAKTLPVLQLKPLLDFFSRILSRHDAQQSADLRGDLRGDFVPGGRRLLGVGGIDGLQI
jgi:hypothetical protein